MIKWQWQDHPFGHPLHSGLRTKPYVSLALKYESDNTCLCNAVILPDRTMKTISATEKAQMKYQLRDWLDNHENM